MLEREPGTGVFSRPAHPDLDGVASDVWGGEWPLGGAVDRRVGEPFSAAPDRPAEAGDLAGMLPGPGLASRLAALSPSDVGDADLVDLISAAERLARWASAAQVAAVAELSRRPVFRPDRDRD